MNTAVRWFKTLPMSPLHFAAGTLLSSAIGAACYFATDSTIERDANEKFTSLVRSAQFTILGRVKSYSDVLYATVSLFHLNPNVSGEDFRVFVEGLQLDKYFPGVEAVNYATYVTEANRAAFEQRMGAATLSNEKQPFRIKPPGPRADYLVLTYIEPHSSARRNQIGLDLMGRAIGVPTMIESRDKGEIGSSGIPIRMNNNTTGLAMRLAVYRPGLPTSTVAERRVAYMGSVGIGFFVERLMGGVLEELPVRGLRMRLIGIAPDNIRRQVLLYDSAPSPESEIAPAATDELQATVPIEFSQRNWQAHFTIKKKALLTDLDLYAPWLALAAGFLSTTLLYALFQTLSSSRRHAIRLAEEMTKELRASESNLQNSNAKLRELAAHAENIKESERKRIAREIHDDLGQNLLALRIEADLLTSRTGDRHPLLHERARRTLNQIDITIKSVRQIINDLRPNVLDLGLNAAVDWQVSEFHRRTGIECELIESHHEVQVSDRCATALFRILQESLTNISRHAKASHVRVELSMNDDTVSMSITDNGVGIRSAVRHKPGSFGLVGIEERINILGGRCVIGTYADGGTSISVSVPANSGSVTPQESELPNVVQNALV
jgi:signal transduction histidine kinase